MEFKKGDRVVYVGEKEGLKDVPGTIDEIINDLSAAYVLFDFPSGKQQLVDVYLHNLEHSKELMTVKQWLSAKKRQDSISETQAEAKALYKKYVVYHPLKTSKIIVGHKHSST